MRLGKRKDWEDGDAYVLTIQDAVGRQSRVVVSKDQINAYRGTVAGFLKRISAEQIQSFVPLVEIELPQDGDVILHDIGSARDDEAY